MNTKNISPMTIVFLVLLVVAIAAVGFLIPKTMEIHGELELIKNATPSPTSNVQSMMNVTFDPNSTPSPTPVLLKIGTAGDEVRKLQDALLALGYYVGEVDGQYGGGTAEAVTRFQNQHGLTADGLAGEGTLAMLYGGQAQVFVPTPVPSPTVELYKMGSTGDGVTSLQQRLHELGYYEQEMDGAFGGGTEEAVKLFQRQNDLTADGIASTNTLTLLYSEQAKVVTLTPTPDPSAMPVLVNKDHPMTEDQLPTGLVRLRNIIDEDLAYVKGSEIEGDKTAVEALVQMFAAARKDGIFGFQISSGYRSIAFQQSLFDDKVDDYMADGFSKEKAISATKLTVAEAGTSEHHTGLAFDITVANTSFKGTEQQKWLAAHAHEYGFIERYKEDKEDLTGFLAEAWHFRYVGIAHSMAMFEKNLCLEEYVGAI